MNANYYHPRPHNQLTIGFLVTQGEDPDLRRQALDKLRLITDRIMLRRVKRDHTESMELPPKEVIIHNEVCVYETSGNFEVVANFGVPTL